MFFPWNWKSEVIFKMWIMICRWYSKSPRWQHRPGLGPSVASFLHSELALWILTGMFSCLCKFCLRVLIFITNFILKWGSHLRSQEKKHQQLDLRRLCLTNRKQHLEDIKPFQSWVHSNCSLKYVLSLTLIYSGSNIVKWYSLKWRENFSDIL